MGIGWAMVAAIVWLSLTPSPPRVDIDAGDKLGHLAAYAVLMFWFARLYARRLPYGVGFVAMGVGLELAQTWVGYRSFELLDMAANTAGVLLGWGSASLFRKRT